MAGFSIQSLLSRWLVLDPGIFYLLLRVLRFSLGVLDYFMDLLLGWSVQNGPKWKRIEAESEYEKSCQVVSVLWKACFSFVSFHQLDSFIYRHVDYVHPRSVLSDDKASLMGVTRTHAYFCVTDPERDVYDTKRCAFLCFAQYFEVRRMLIMPHASLKRLAEEVGDPKELVIIAMTARCGSTLLCQMFARLPRTRVISEPLTTVHLHRFYNKGQLSSEDHRELIRACIRLHCKKSSSVATLDRFVIKMQHRCCPQFPTYRDLFPDCRLFFITRHPKPSTTSFMNIFLKTPTLSNVFDEGTKAIHDHLPFPYDNKHLQTFRASLSPAKLLLTKLQVKIAIGFAGCMACLMQNRNTFDKIVLYEDLLSSPAREASEILEIIGAPSEQVSLALEAMESHSQNNIFGTDGMRTKLTEGEWDEVDKKYGEMMVPISTKMTLGQFREFVHGNHGVTA